MITRTRMVLSMFFMATGWIGVWLVAVGAFRLPDWPVALWWGAPLLFVGFVGLGFSLPLDEDDASGVVA